MYKETYDIVSKNREAMDKIVDLLIEKETLDGDEFVSILSKFTKIPEKERTPQLLSYTFFGFLSITRSINPYSTASFGDI